MLQTQNGALVLALLSAILFSGSSVIFARFSVSHSSLWMNLMKNTTALVAFAVAAAVSLTVGGESLAGLTLRPSTCFFLSGLLGLGIGDYFLFRGYQRLGSARTMLVFSLSPIFLTIEGWLVFHQNLSLVQGIAILLMMACVWTISFEKFRAEGHWEWKGIGFAFLGVLLDNVGIVLSRQAFDLSPGTTAFTANVIRCIGSVIPLLIWGAFSGEKVFRRFGRLEWRDRALVVFSGFMGSFLSLALWLTALKIGMIGGLAAVGSFNPIAASLWEWLLLRRRPSAYLIAALVLFLSGFFLLIRPT
ncbi:MAG: EamA family transporter [Bdellovibrionota bacterium]